MKKEKKNIVLSDNSYEESKAFVDGLIESTNYFWEAKVLTANKGRKNKIYNFIRYFKYFYFSFIHFLKRKNYGCIIGWQEFYGLIFAFYCRLFHVKKVNNIIVKNLVYKHKKGFIGKIYFKFMRYIIKSKYIDVFICSSESYCKYVSELFGEDISRFVFVPFGVNDFSKDFDQKNAIEGDYVLSLGRSNRDWPFLINSLKDIDDINLKIICDELNSKSKYKNIEIINNVFGDDSIKYIAGCKIMIIPILDGKIVSGETVLLMAMSFGKPIIVTEPSSLAENYIDNLTNGIIIKKSEKDLREWIYKLCNDEDLYSLLSSNARKSFEEKYSLFSFGKNVGYMLQECNLLKRE